MKIERRKKSGVVILDLKGKILTGDAITEIRATINNLVKENETKVVFNFADVPYLDSTGLGEIVRSFTSIKKIDGTVKILNLTSRVKDLMTITKLITVFECFEDEEKAINSFG
jgi:anti-sigma B factor antagonist